MTYTWAGNSASATPTACDPATVTDRVRDREPASDAAAGVGGSLKIAGFNVLNYFLTLDDGGDDCGPAGNKQECRGAETAEEYERQHAKLIAALVDIDADIFGFARTREHRGRRPARRRSSPASTRSPAPARVVGARHRSHRHRHDPRRDDLPPTRSTPLGAHAVLDSSVDPLFDRQPQPPDARAVVRREARPAR